MTKQLKLSALVAALLASTSALATKPGYLVDETTDVVTRNTYGECWRDAYFDKERDGLVECGDKEVLTPPPVAVVKEPTMTALKEKVVLSAKVLFDFDKVTLRADARHELEPLVARLRDDSNLKAVEITGHTDFMGPERYNMVLSQRRADRVKAYFEAAGIPPEKITAIGRGKADATMTEECKAKHFKKKAALKACIEPDRRVELNIDTVKEVIVEEPPVD